MQESCYNSRKKYKFEKHNQTTIYEKSKRCHFTDEYIINTTGEQLKENMWTMFQYRYGIHLA